MAGAKKRSSTFFFFFLDASHLTVTETFTYTTTDGDTATVTVTVSGVDSNDTLLDSPDIDSLAGGIGNDVYYSETPATR